MKKVRVLQVGVGNFGEGWARNIIPACSEITEFVGIVDRRSDRLAEFQGIAPLFMNLEEALEAAKPELVINVTPPDMHTPLNLMLIKRGFAVLCEKPLADSNENADLIERLLGETRGFLMIGENYRYKTVLRTLRGMIKSGNFGQVHRVSCSFRRRHPDMSTLYHGRLAHPLLEDVTIHHLDVARFLSGEEPLDVWCREAPAYYSWYGDKPASAVIVSEMTHGVSFTYEGTLAAATCITDWNGFWDIECDKAVLMLRGNEIHIATEDGTEIIGGFDKEEDSRLQELKEACAAIREERKGETDFSNNIHSFRWMTGAIHSAFEKQTIHLRED